MNFFRPLLLTFTFIRASAYSTAEINVYAASSLSDALMDKAPLYAGDHEAE